MNRIWIYAGIAALCLSGCARDEEAVPNDNARRYFESWVSTNHPSSERTELGSCILEQAPGSGADLGSVSDSPYVLVEFTISDLDGNIERTTDEGLARQLGTFDRKICYGPQVWQRGENYAYAGVDEILSQMQVGGSVRVAIPGWLFSYKRYGSAKDYLNKVTGSDAVYEIRVKERITDIEQWELDSLSRYFASSFPGVDPESAMTETGYYYVRTGEPTSETAFASGDKVYINYCARRLDGQVFDTNVSDTAYLHKILVDGKKYEPVLINWSAEAEDLTMTASATSLISGFAKAVHGMLPGEKGSCLFYSGLGYKGIGTGYTSGKGYIVPPFCPIRFDIEITTTE